MSEYVKALIAVKSKERRDALAALLESLKQIHVIYQAGNEQATRDVLEAHSPTLVLADFEFFDGVRDRCAEVVIVLVINRAEQAQAHAKGATRVFIEGTPVNQLVATIEQSLRDTK